MEHPLLPISVIPEQFRALFPYPYFNNVQSACFSEAFYTSHNLVVQSPTGSGKTVIFEFAMLRLISERPKGIKQTMVYIAPTKALCQERVIDWTEKLQSFDIAVQEVTGDRSPSFAELHRADLLVITPEKWDSITRKWKDHRAFMEQIALLMLDEVHMLSEDRGGTLEAVVARMRTISGASLRFVAASATIPNVDDVAAWLQAPSEATFAFGEEYRPVPLERIVIAYPPKPNYFIFDRYLDYKVLELVLQHGGGKPVLVFCPTRKGSFQTAQEVCRQLQLRARNPLLNKDQVSRLSAASGKLSDKFLQSYILQGVGFHHAGVEMNDRKIIESLFLAGDLPILCTTSTLSLGVNLPARTVIIKGTGIYRNGTFSELSDAECQQMIGRAGRPQFDDRGLAIILTSTVSKQRFEELTTGQKPLESHLKDSLIEHMNAEVVLKTIQNADIALEWLKNTFFWIRIKKNPRFYGVAPLGDEQLDQFCTELCNAQLRRLQKEGMMVIQEDGSFAPTKEGCALARFYLRFETVVLFREATPDSTIETLLHILSRAREFADLRLRVADKKHLNALNKAIRFPFKGKIKKIEQKISVLIQASLGQLSVEDWSLKQETLQVFSTATRIMGCMVEWLWERTSPSDQSQPPKSIPPLTTVQPLCSALILKKCLLQRIWENSATESSQLEGIGPAFSATLQKAGLSSLEQIASADPRRIELLLGRRPPFGDRVVDEACALPRFILSLEQVQADVPTAKLNIRRVPQMREISRAIKPQEIFLFVKGPSEEVVLKRRFNNASLPTELSLEFNPNGHRKLVALLINEDYIGLDTQTELSLHFAAPLPASSHDPPILGSSAAKFDKAKRAARDAKKPAQQIQAQPPAQPKQSHPPSDLERTKRSSESSLPNHVEKRPRIVEDDDDDGEDRTENGRRPSAKAPSRHVAPHLLALLREKVRALPPTPALQNIGPPTSPCRLTSTASSSVSTAGTTSVPLPPPLAAPAAESHTPPSASSLSPPRASPFFPPPVLPALSSRPESHKQAPLQSQTVSSFFSSQPGALLTQRLYEAFPNGSKSPPATDSPPSRLASQAALSLGEGAFADLF